MKLKIEEKPVSHRVMFSVPDNIFRLIDSLPEVKAKKVSFQQAVLQVVKQTLEKRKAG